MQNKETLSHLMKEDNVSTFCNNVSARLWVAISAYKVGNWWCFCLFALRTTIFLQYVKNGNIFFGSVKQYYLCTLFMCKCGFCLAQGRRFSP